MRGWTITGFVALCLCLPAISSAQILPAPTDPGPANPAPANPAPINPAPINPAPINPAPANPAPANPAPANPAPANPAPANSAAANQAPANPAQTKSDVPSVDKQRAARYLAWVDQHRSELEVAPAELERLTMDLAIGLAVVGQIDRALEIAGELEPSPRFSALLSMARVARTVGQAAQAQKCAEKAESVLEKSIEAWPRQPAPLAWWLSDLAEYQAQQGNLEAAEAAIKRIRAAWDPEFVQQSVQGRVTMPAGHVRGEAWTKVAIAMVEIGQVEPAFEVIQRISRKPTRLLATYTLAQVLANQGQAAKALVYFERARAETRAPQETIVITTKSGPVEVPLRHVEAQTIIELADGFAQNERTFGEARRWIDSLNDPQQWLRGMMRVSQTMAEHGGEVLAMEWISLLPDSGPREWAQLALVGKIANTRHWDWLMSIQQRLVQPNARLLAMWTIVRERSMTDQDEKAIQLLAGARRLVEKAVEQTSFELNSRSYDLLARIEFTLGDRAAGLVTARKTVELARKIQNVRERDGVLSDAALTWAMAGQAQGRDLVDELANEQSKASVLIDMAAAVHEAGQPDLAVQWWEDAITMTVSMTNPVNQVATLSQVGSEVAQTTDRSVLDEFLGRSRTVRIRVHLLLGAIDELLNPRSVPPDGAVAGG